MNTSIVLLLVVLGFIELKALSSNNCNDDCQTKSYGLTKDGVVGCSGADCLMEGTFRSSLINGRIVFNINLIGYGLSSYGNSAPFFSVILAKGTEEAQYSCELIHNDEVQTLISKNGKYYMNGSAKVSNDNLYCSWFMTQNIERFPMDGAYRTNWPELDLLSDRDIKIIFVVYNKTFDIVSDISELPIYHLQSLKCCHIVHGNSNYQLVIDQTDKQTNFFLNAYRSNIARLSVALKDSHGKKLVFTCGLAYKSFQGYLKTKDSADDITHQLSSSNLVQRSQCSWALPLTINTSSSTYETKNGIYDLKILENGEVVYTEPKVSLKEFVTEPPYASSRGFGATAMANLILIFSCITIF